MGNEMFIRIADDISEKMILISKDKKCKNKSIIELYDELLDKKYLEYKYCILSYIPERLSVKGYEIVNSSKFELKKY